MTALRSVVPLAAVAAGVLVSAVARAEAQPGAIDWTTRTIKCKGQASPNPSVTTISQARIGAERAARLDAMRNILETLKGVTIDGARTAADALLDDGVSSKVQGLIRGFRVTDTRYFSDGGVEVDVELPLDGLIGALLPPGSRSNADPAATSGATGIVVDAHLLKVVPALAPRLVDQEGHEVYGPSRADLRQARNGLAAYTNDLAAAEKDPRVGEQPAVMKAVALVKDSPSDLVISDDDAKKAREARLSDGNVVIVIPRGALQTGSAASKAPAGHAQVSP